MNNVDEYKINIQKSVTFLYVNSELAERKIKKSILLTTAMKRIKYLGINLSRKWKNITLKTIRHCSKILKKTQINVKIFHAHGLEELTLSKCPYYLKQSTDSMQSLSESQRHCHRNRTKNSKIYMEPQRPWISKAVLRKKK